jgi:hypothetical protein
MIVSTSMTLISGVILFTVKLLYRLKNLDDDWLREYGDSMIIASSIMSIVLATFTLNTAFLCNIYRWKMVIAKLRDEEKTKLTADLQEY